MIYEIDELFNTNLEMIEISVSKSRYPNTAKLLLRSILKIRSLKNVIFKLEEGKDSYVGIFEQHKYLDVTVKRTILDTIFHNLLIVKKMYTDTFGISFPKTEKMYNHVLVRHDIVHRNGKTKEGTELVINDTQIDMLIEDVTDFIDSICIELKIK